MRRGACVPRRYRSTHTVVQADRVRCFALPLLPKKWAFYPDTHHVHNNDLFGGANHSFKGRIGQLFDRARSEWEECVHAPPGTMRNRLFKISVKLQSRIDPRELLCRAFVPHHIENVSLNVVPRTDVTIMYPAGINEEEVRQAFLGMLVERVSRHTAFKWGSVALLPVTLAMGILPGPNVFFVWNLLRLWSHHRAEKGARAALAASTQLELQPSEEMRGLLGNADDRDVPVSDEALQRLEQRFDLPALQGYMQRTRERFLKEKR